MKKFFGVLVLLAIVGLMAYACYSWLLMVVTAN